MYSSDIDSEKKVPNSVFLHFAATLCIHFQENCQLDSLLNYLINSSRKMPLRKGMSGEKYFIIKNSLSNI